MSEVKLIAISKPNSGETNCFNPNELIAYTARVSNPSNQDNRETAPRLLRYLIKHQHWSPFEMVHMTLEINTTRDIARQILRHRSFSFQEFSQRYAEATKFTVREARLQDPKNRQNSIELDLDDFGKGESTTPSERLYEDWWMQQQKVIRQSQEAYNWALRNGIAKEQARAVLPEGNTESCLYMAGSLRSWIHYCVLRMGPETQKEHRIVAQKCWKHVKVHFPDIAEAVEDEIV